MLQDEYLLVKIGFDTAENEPSKSELLHLSIPRFRNENITWQGPYICRTVCTGIVQYPGDMQYGDVFKPHFRKERPHVEPRQPSSSRRSFMVL